MGLLGHIQLIKIFIFRSIIQKYKFTAFLAVDFLEAAKVHATYRFIIKGKKFKQPYILASLFLFFFKKKKLLFYVGQ